MTALLYILVSTYLIIVHFYNDAEFGQSIVRYRDAQAGCTYTIKPLVGFDDITEKFLKILIK